MPRRHLNWPLALCVLCIVLAAGVAYGPSIRTFFFQDDFMFLERVAQARSLGSAVRLFTAKDNTFYRPVPRALILGIEWRLFGLRSEWYHLVNVFAHSLNAMLVFLLARRFYARIGPSLAAGLLFAAHPLSFTAVYWICGVQELSLVCFLLLSMLLYDKWSRAGGIGWYALSLATYTAALFSKEPAVVFPALVVLWELCRCRSNLRRLHWAALARSTLGYVPLVAFYLIVHTLQTLPGSMPESYAMAFKLPTVATNLSAYLGDLLFADRWVESAPWMAQPFLIASTVALAGLGYFCRRFRWGVVLGAGWFGIALLPVVFLASRAYSYYAYLALAGAAIAFGEPIAAAVRLLDRSMPDPPFRSLQAAARIVGIGSLALSWALFNRYVPLAAEARDPSSVATLGAVARHAATSANSLFPQLEEGSTLYVTGLSEVDEWTIGFGDMFRLYYPSAKVVLVRKDEAIPAVADADQSRVRVFSMLD